MATKRIKTKTSRPVLVGTDRTALWFGYMTEEPVFYDGVARVKITNARLIAFWDSQDKLAPGLAANGPSDACRVTPAAPSATLFGVCSVIDVAQSAVEKFEKAPWGR